MRISFGSGWSFAVTSYVLDSSFLKLSSLGGRFSSDSIEIFSSIVSEFGSWLRWRLEKKNCISLSMKYFCCLCSSEGLAKVEVPSISDRPQTRARIVLPLVALDKKK